MKHARRSARLRPRQARRCRRLRRPVHVAGVGGRRRRGHARRRRPGARAARDGDRRRRRPQRLARRSARRRQDDARATPPRAPAADDGFRALEVTRIDSAAGLNIGGGLVERRPFRAPHHSTTPAGLVGGGARTPRPGEFTLAHNGVLFLDELPEFSRAALEVLDEPLATGEVLLARALGHAPLPRASDLVVASVTPCPCGRLGTLSGAALQLQRPVQRALPRRASPSGSFGTSTSA